MGLFNVEENQEMRMAERKVCLPDEEIGTERVPGETPFAPADRFMLPQTPADVNRRRPHHPQFLRIRKVFIFRLPEAETA